MNYERINELENFADEFNKKLEDAYKIYEEVIFYIKRQFFYFFQNLEIEKTLEKHSPKKNKKPKEKKKSFLINN